MNISLAVRYTAELFMIEREWKYFLGKKGIDCIEPLPIDPPDICPPPYELRNKYFNDRMLYLIKR